MRSVEQWHRLATTMYGENSHRCRAARVESTTRTRDAASGVATPKRFRPHLRLIALFCVFWILAHNLVLVLTESKAMVRLGHNTNDGVTQHLTRPEPTTTAGH